MSGTYKEIQPFIVDGSLCPDVWDIPPLEVQQQRASEFAAKIRAVDTYDGKGVQPESVVSLHGQPDIGPMSMQTRYENWCKEKGRDPNGVTWYSDNLIRFKALPNEDGDELSFCENLIWNEMRYFFSDVYGNGGFYIDYTSFDKDPGFVYYFITKLNRKP
jgi:hypothetical protein